MYGANYHGQPQYGQGPALYIPPITKSLTVTVTCTASISASQITNKMLHVTVTCTASIIKQFQRSVAVTVSSLATLTSVTTRPLKLIAAATKFLNSDRHTITATTGDADAYFQADYFQNDYFQIGVFSVLGGTATTTKGITPERSTRKIEE